MLTISGLPCNPAWFFQNYVYQCLPFLSSTHLSLSFLCCLVLPSKPVRTPETSLEGSDSLSAFARQVNRCPVGTQPQGKGTRFLAAPAAPHTGGLHWRDLISLFRVIKNLLQPCLCPSGGLSICTLTADGESHCFGGEIGGGSGGPFITPRGIGGWDTLQRVLLQALPLEAEEESPSSFTADGHPSLPWCVSSQTVYLGALAHPSNIRGCLPC